MSYEEACSVRISRARARAEIERHQCDFTDFTAEYGDSPTYAGADVLAWLGY